MEEPKLTEIVIYRGKENLRKRGYKQKFEGKFF